MNRLRMLLLQLRHPRRRYFVSTDVQPFVNTVVYGYTEGDTIHITAVEVTDV